MYIYERSVLLFLNKMERYKLGPDLPDSVNKIFQHDAPLLTVLTNGNVESRVKTWMLSCVCWFDSTHRGYELGKSVLGSIAESHKSNGSLS